MNNPAITARKIRREKEKSLFSEQQHKQMWTPQTIEDCPPNPPYNSHFKNYGWQLTDVKGTLQVGHRCSGRDRDAGHFTARVEFGNYRATNQQSGAAFHAITNTIWTVIWAYNRKIMS
jgi:hypothetical protein